MQHMPTTAGDSAAFTESASYIAGSAQGQGLPCGCQQLHSAAAAAATVAAEACISATPITATCSNGALT